MDYIDDYELSLEALTEDRNYEDELKYLYALETYFNPIRELMKKYDYANENIALEATETGYSEKRTNPVFIVLTEGESFLSPIIKKATHSPFSHACITFNMEMNPIYSFGTNKVNERLNMPTGFGFVKAKPEDPIWGGANSGSSSVKYSVFVTHVTDKELNKMYNRLEYFLQNADKMKFNTIGLAYNFFQKPSPKKYAWFCSAFVAEILGEGRKLNKDSTLYSPADLSNIKYVKFLYKGNDIVNHDSNKMRKAYMQFLKKEKAKMARRKEAIKKK